MNKGTINYVVVFGLGALTGSLITYKLASKKQADEIIVPAPSNDEPKDGIVIISNDLFDALEKENEQTPDQGRYPWGAEKPDPEQLVKLIKDEAYSDLRKEYKDMVDILVDDSDEEGILLEEEKAIEPKDNDYIYQISPEEYGETDFNLRTFTYYPKVNIMTDENEDIIYDYERFVGSDIEDWIGEYSDQTLYVSNDKVQEQYEIIFDYVGEPEFK